MEQERLLAEFQAVILCGGRSSNSLSPVSEHLPVGLLPIANRPLIVYQLYLLQSCGFREALLACPADSLALYRKAVARHFKTELADARQSGNAVTSDSVSGAASTPASAAGVSADVVASMDELQDTGVAGDNSNSEDDEDPRRRHNRLVARLVPLPGDAMGSGDALLACADYLRTDFFVLSQDLLTTLYPHFLADVYRTTHPRSVCTALLVPSPDSIQARRAQAKGVAADQKFDVAEFERQQEEQKRLLKAKAQEAAGKDKKAGGKGGKDGNKDKKQQQQGSAGGSGGAVDFSVDPFAKLSKKLGLPPAKQFYVGLTPSDPPRLVMFQRSTAEALENGGLGGFGVAGTTGNVGGGISAAQRAAMGSLADDDQTSGQYLRLPKAMLRRFPDTTLYRAGDVQDAHMYLFSSKVLSLLQQQEDGSLTRQLAAALSPEAEQREQRRRLRELRRLARGGGVEGVDEHDHELTDDDERTDDDEEDDDENKSSGDKGEESRFEPVVDGADLQGIFGSLQSDLLPYLVAAQFTRGGKDWALAPAPQAASEAAERLRGLVGDSEDARAAREVVQLLQQQLQMSEQQQAAGLGSVSTISGAGSANSAHNNASGGDELDSWALREMQNTGSDEALNNLVQCHAVLAPSNYICERVQSFGAYLRLNLEMARRQGSSGGEQELWPLAENHREAALATCPKAQVQGGSLLGRDVQLMEGAGRIVINSSVIGNGCKIAAGCRLERCVLMDGVSLAENVQLTDCIVGPGVEVGKDSSLQGCVVGGRYSIASGTQAQQEAFSIQEFEL